MISVPVYLGFIHKNAGTPTPVKLLGGRAVEDFIAEAQKSEATQGVSIYLLEAKYERTVTWVSQPVTEEPPKLEAAGFTEDQLADPAPAS